MRQRVLVCGGRDYNDLTQLYEVLDVAHAANPIVMLISGAARGADSLAARWADTRDVPLKLFPADWIKHGKAAGPIRNQKMLDEGKPHIVIAFPGGAGTDHMVSIAEKASIPVVRVNPR